VRTFIFAGSLGEAKEYQNRNCLFGADILLSDYPLMGVRECEVHLVGTYQRNSAWEAIRIRLTTLRMFGSVQVHVEEWSHD
jgi:hypothetical protein